MINDELRVIETVRRYLEPHQPLGYRLNVMEQGIRHTSDDWWEVVVRPSRDDIHTYEYFGRLAEVENDIEDHEHLKILLLPVLPG